MKNLLTTALAVLPLLGQAQAPAGKFVLQGKVASKAVTKAYLRYTLDERRVVDSAVVKRGAFQFQGALASPVAAYLTLSHGGTTLAKSRDMAPLYLEPGTLKLTTPDSASKVAIKGSALNTSAAQLQAQLKPLDKEYKALLREYVAGRNAHLEAAALDKIEARADANEAAQNEIKYAYLTMRRTSPPSRLGCAPPRRASVSPTKSSSSSAWPSAPPPPILLKTRPMASR
jgi:hypothetical protein